MKPTTHRGGLAPDKYLKPEELDAVTTFVRARATSRKSRRARTDYMIIHILAGAGLRASEVCDLTLQDLPGHHGKSVLHIRDGKGNISRSVQIGGHLQNHIACYAEEYRIGNTDITQPLILSRTGTKMAYVSIYRKCTQIGNEMELTSKLNPHKFRHSFAIKLYEIEKDIAFVSRQLGHADLKTTMVYVHTTPETARRQMEAM